MSNKVKIIICQLGSPKSSSVADVRSYLKEFLGDPRVVDAPRFIWFFVLNLIILRFRPKRSAKAYKRIEFCSFFPLVEITKAFVRGIRKHMDPARYEICESFVLSAPRIKEVVSEKDLEQGKVIFSPQFPQFSDTTTSSCLDQLYEHMPTARGHKNLIVLDSFHRFKAFIDLSVKQIEAHLKKYPVSDLVISFHGIPVRYVVDKNDPYYVHCLETFELFCEKLSLRGVKLHMTFQSRLGSEEWLNPYTDEYVVDLVEKGSKNVGVYCPSFTVDCLETTDEIGNELGEEVEEVGGELVFIPCLNNNDDWADAFANLLVALGDDEEKAKQELFYEVSSEKSGKKVKELEETYHEDKLNPEAKKTIKIVFLTLFLDLIGFSIIFPMFPALAEYYLTVDADNYFLNLIFSSISSLTQVSGTSMSGIVLFGGALGALYSLLQFFAAPLWGGLSDKYGRRPILLVSVFGLFVSYVLWIFSGSFTLLIVARIIGGIMGGNLSVASAAVADVTTTKTRSKGMAFVGIAFALGFIFGPALGGALSLINPVEINPDLAKYGINPFSVPALLAAALSLLNLFMIWKRFGETLNTENRSHTRSSNVLKLLTPLKNKNVNLTNYSYFLFIMAFSGMEFTLTFLAVERLGYSSMDNAYMFIFIGVVIALVQGGVVRRKAHQVGEKKMALAGFASIIPGLLLIALASSSFGVYAGLFFLAMGSAMAIPTLTSLVSIHSLDSEQGHSLGIFRSLGALGRVIGPIIASLIYWKYGSAVPYFLGASFLILPILILTKVESR